ELPYFQVLIVVPFCHFDKSFFFALYSIYLSLIQEFKYPRSTLSCAHTHGHYTIQAFHVSLSHFIKKLDGKFGPSAPKGMAQGNGPSVHVHNFWIEVQFADHGQGL